MRHRQDLATILDRLLARLDGCLQIRHHERAAEIHRGRRNDLAHDIPLAQMHVEVIGLAHHETVLVIRHESPLRLRPMYWPKVVIKPPSPQARHD